MTVLFAELVAATNFSFLRGASHPSDMVAQAIQLGMTGIGIADRNTVAGVVRAHVALKEAREEIGRDIDFKLVAGARLAFVDETPDIIAYPATRYGWGRLTRLLSRGNLRSEKGGCILRFADLLEFLDDLLLIVMPYASPNEERPRRKTVVYDGLEIEDADPGALNEILCTLCDRAVGRIWLGATMPRRGDDARRLVCLAEVAKAAGIPLLATNDALYAGPDDRPVQDVLTCIREGVTLAEAGQKLEANAERHLKSPGEMARLFAACPETIASTQALMDRVSFTLEDLKYEYPHEPVPEGWAPQSWLRHLVETEAHKRHPDGIPRKMRDVLEEELGLIERRNYACYFLTVHDVVKFARDECDPPILCQGRGSAANSLVCYLLGITPVDPIKEKLLFTRFLSEERHEPPDIDVDFEHERREEVMQYVYERYGRHRAGIAATVIHYRSRSAVREVGKVLGLSEDVTSRMTSTVWGSWGDVDEERISETGLDPGNPEIDRLHELVRRILNFPRHLSQHVGGFVLTEDRLDETVPIHNAAMDNRTFIEWDKDDIDALGLMKVDVLALGMLTAIRKSFDLMRLHGLGDRHLDNVPAEDPAVYAMLRKADSIGTFQVESRAQINMLPRLKPREFYDLVIQVALVRPGPIQGEMVHPYLRRRNGEEPIEFPSPDLPHDPDELRDILERTCGVPLFQEQAMKLAIVAAGFTPAEANELRRAMATFRNPGTIHELEEKMVDGMVRRGYKPDFARRCFGQIKGFGEYGFPESHAQAFAHLAYVSSWLKCHHPAVFTCALLNSQPMGFYAPAQLVRDARDHDVEVCEIDINASHWDSTLERSDKGSLALRMGFRQIDGFREEWGKMLLAARTHRLFDSMEALGRRAGLPSRALRLLADADACRSIGLDRREALWNARRMPEGELPLFAAARAAELADEPGVTLPAMPLSEHVATDYQMTRLSLKAHPMAFLRSLFRSESVLSCAEISAGRNGARVKAAGVVLCRQRPGKGNAVFITIEDETGIANALLWARLMNSQRQTVMASRLMVIEGVIQRSREGVVHLMATRIHDRSDELERLTSGCSIQPQPSYSDEIAHPQMPRGNGHPRNVRILPRSRDFH
jgi:error-prone DNA polymerase